MNDKAEEYILSLSAPEPPLLAELYRQTHLRLMNPRMASGHLQGRLLSLISKLIRPVNILEIGTFTGYGTICLAEGLADGGRIHTIDNDDEVLEFARPYFEKAGIMEKTVIHTGDARLLVPAINISFQLVYIDGEKREYPDYYRAVLPKLAPGGLMLADNVLWNNKVLQEPGKNDRSTQGVMEFNRMVMNDPGVEQIILPVRDGIMLIRKKNINEQLYG